MRHPLWLGATAVTLPAEPFRTDPLGWLRAISRHGITETVAPDILHARCAALLGDEPPAGLDLSRWRTSLNAVEPVSAGTMAAFPHRCAPLGLRPGTLAAGYVPAEGAPVAPATGRAPVPGADFAVVDPLTGRRLRDALLVDGHTLHPQDAERELLRCARALGWARVFCAGPGAGALWSSRRSSVRSAGRAPGCPGWRRGSVP
ncbi:AMP-binding protein [Streptomyces melanosporofaciens]|uniref:AMP-binding protein n=1 Tax=Streptomyces melanosporofaciens TaxID=67327 RepID=UPI000B09EF20|nr:AMP-binding protein [Streptomyces melanosporofaciens]